MKTLWSTGAIEPAPHCFCLYEHEGHLNYSMTNLCSTRFATMCRELVMAHVLQTLPRTIYRCHRQGFPQSNGFDPEVRLPCLRSSSESGFQEAGSASPSQKETELLLSEIRSHGFASRRRQLISAGNHFGQKPSLRSVRSGGSQPAACSASGLVGTRRATAGPADGCGA